MRSTRTGLNPTLSISHETINRLHPATTGQSMSSGFTPQLTRAFELRSLRRITEIELAATRLTTSEVIHTVIQWSEWKRLGARSAVMICIEDLMSASL